MKKTKIFTILSIFFILISCRDDLTGLHHRTGNLTVSVSVDKTLYQGEYLQDLSGRFIGPSSNSMTLTYTTGEKEFSTAVDITLSGTGNTFTGTATLKNLPAGVEGSVLVTTFDASGAILCDGNEVFTLTAGENQITLTLRISELCPYLSLANAAEYLDEILTSKETQFIKIRNLQQGTRYDIYAYQEVETSDPPYVSIITESGTVIESEDLDKDHGVCSFILPQGEDSAIICFYNPFSYAIPGLIWIDKRSAYTSVVYGGHYYADGGTMGYYSPYYRIAAGNGKLFLTSQEYTGSGEDGLWISSNRGSSFSNTPIENNFMNTAELTYPAEVTDMIYRNGMLYTSIYHNVSDSGEIGVAIFNPQLGNITQMFTSWNTSAGIYTTPFEHHKLAKSNTHTFMALLESDSLTLFARKDGSNVTSEITTASFFTSGNTENELQITAINDVLYILGDSTVYSWTAGSGSIQQVFTMDNSMPELFRYLSLYKDRYLIASNGNNSYLYIPEFNKIIALVDYNEIQLYLPDPMMQDIYVMETGSNNFILNLSLVTGDGSYDAQSMALDVITNGGFNRLVQGVVPVSNLPVDWQYYLPCQILMDEEAGVIYIGGIEHGEGDSYLWHYFTLQ